MSVATILDNISLVKEEIAYWEGELRQFQAELDKHVKAGERMAHYARLIASELAASHGISEETVERIFLFAPLHDIGNVGIPSGILAKQGGLDVEERHEMERHVDKGLEILDRLIDQFAIDQEKDAALMRDIVGSHHECLDGSGYPRGLKGEAIPITARIVAVADILDALTSSRPQRLAWSLDQAFAELDRLVGLGKLDHDCVEVVKRSRPQIEEIRERCPDPISEG